MPIPARPALTAEDLIASRTLFSKIFQGIFPFTSINFYLPDSPQSVLSWRESISLEEFSDLNREAKEGVTYDPIRKRLFCHLFFNGQSLGFLVFFGFSRHCSPEDIALMNHLVKIGLEMTILQKQTQLDPATGLYLEWAFRKRALRQWKQWIKKEEESAKKPEKLSLAEAPSQETLVFGLLSIRPKPVPSEGSFSEKEWKIWIKEIRKTFPEETIWAVIDHYPLTLAFYVPLFPGKETAFLSNASLKTLAFTSETMIHLGWAALDLHRPESVQGSLSAFSLLNHCWEQAETALKMSRSMIDSCAFNYHDLLYRAGRVIDLLPGHRLVINLGHTAGVTAFMRFSVNNGDP
ncbi:MAG TPA: hypothetical protein VK564_08120, partial [Thermodesulfobacteriota bacterium]|nr:hypothetical protein [Thermodesulfobacteriota bacterium]